MSPGPCTTAKPCSGGPSTTLTITTIGPPSHRRSPTIGPFIHWCGCFSSQLNIHDIVCACPHYVKLRNTLPDQSTYCIVGYFPKYKISQMDSQLRKIYSGMLCKIQLWVVGGTQCDYNISLILTCCIQCRTLLSSTTLSLRLQLLQLKLQLATVGVMNGSSIQTQVYRGVDKYLQLQLLQSLR